MVENDIYKGINNKQIKTKIYSNNLTNSSG